MEPLRRKVQTSKKYENEHESYGIFFEIKCLQYLPVTKITLNSLTIMTNMNDSNVQVFSSFDINDCHNITKWKKHKILSKTKSSSSSLTINLQEVIPIERGTRKTLFIHSPTGLNYSTERSSISYRDEYLIVYSGIGYSSSSLSRTSLSQYLRPFREFVGDIDVTIERHFYHPQISPSIQNLFPVEYILASRHLYSHFGDLAVKILKFVSLSWFRTLGSSVYNETLLSDNYYINEVTKDSFGTTPTYSVFDYNYVMRSLFTGVTITTLRRRHRNRS
eukprot:maker-scaffold_13-snap-gene-7.5-mRNA-1 protein AED:0.00 eAED:0.00 QI:115/1/1/1/1/1/2/583/275